MPDRVTVFIDGQNAYNCARAAFFPLVRARHFTDGQFNPMALGELLAARDARGFERELHEVRVYTGRPDCPKLGELLAARDARGFERELHEVRVYTGRPDSAKDPKSYGAHMKQCARGRRG